MRYAPHIAAILIVFSAMSASGSGTGTMSINGGFVSGIGTISGSVNVGAAGSLSPGAAIGTLPIDGSLNLSAMADGGSGKLVFSLDSRSATNDKITTTGTLTIGVGKLGFSDFTFTNLGGLEVGTYTLITSNGINSGDSLDSGNLSGTINGLTCTLSISGGNINLVVSDTFENWAANYLPADVSDPTGNNDGGSLTNLQEFAFGTDPTVLNSASLSYTPGGAVTPGLPIASNLSVGSGVDYRAVFCRRKDYQAAGLTYTVEFSANLSTWVPSNATPTRLSAPNSNGPVDAVSVPYPLFIPTARGVEKPKFFRVGVSKNP